MATHAGAVTTAVGIAAIPGVPTVTSTIGLAAVPFNTKSYGSVISTIGIGSQPASNSGDLANGRYRR